MEIFKNFDHVVSLGYNCFPKLFLNKIDFKQETFFFDWLGTTMVSINSLIDNKFQEVVDPKHFKIIKTNNKKTPILVANKKYNFGFMHDFLTIPTKTSIVPIKKKYTHRAEKFLNLIQSGKKILFIRLEPNFENEKNDILFIKDKMKSISEKTDLEHLKEFSKKMPKELNFKIILLSSTQETHYNKEEKILVLKFDDRGIDYKIFDKIIFKVLEDNKELIQSSILI